MPSREYILRGLATDAIDHEEYDSFGLHRSKQEFTADQVRYVLDFGIVRKMVFDEERAMQPLGELPPGLLSKRVHSISIPSGPSEPHICGHPIMVDEPSNLGCAT